MLLRDLARRVELRGRIGASSSTRSQPSCRRRAGSADRTRPASRSARASAAAGRPSPCSGSEAALAVDHHRRGQHQPVGSPPRPSPRAAPRCRGRCGRRRPAGLRRRPRCRPSPPGGTPRRPRPAARDRAGVADVEPPHVRRAGSAPSPCAASSTRRRRRRRGRRRAARSHPWADEAGGAGHQHPHGSSTAASMPSCARQCGDSRRSGDTDRSPRAAALTARCCARTRRTHPPRAPLPRVQPGVEVGHQRDCGVTQLQLAGEHRLGVAGHVHQLDQPCAANHWDSARVENRGPSTTTIAPPSMMSGLRRDRRAQRGQYGSAKLTCSRRSRSRSACDCVVRSTSWSGTTSAPGPRSGVRLPTAQGPKTRRTPSARSAHRFAR